MNLALSGRIMTALRRRMAKLSFYRASMNAGKSTTLRSMAAMPFTAAIDDRSIALRWKAL